jgi:hypothetical protein
MRRGAPDTHDAPQRRRDRADSHFCDEVGSRVYCSALDCPFCSDDEQDDDLDGRVDE